MGKSRHEKRKEGRVERNEKKYCSWLEHQKYQKAKRTSRDLKLKDMNDLDFCKGEVIEPDDKPMGKQMISEQNATMKKVKDKCKSSTTHDSLAMNTTEKKKGLKRIPRTKFEEFLEMNKPNGGLSAEEDLKLERKLAKKLKVKGGKLRGEEDDINVLFEGIPFVLDSSTEALNASRKNCKKNKSVEQDLEGELINDLMVDASEPKESGGFRVSSEEILVGEPSEKKCKKRKLTQEGQVSKMPIDTIVNLAPHVGVRGVEVELGEVNIPAKAPVPEGSIKYLAPHLRSRAQNESEDLTQVRRRVRGLLNRMSESNVESIAGEMSSVFRSVTRSVASQICGEEILASCSSGPRGNEQYAAVFGAFIAGMACLVGVDFSAKLLASLAKTFEDEYLKEDNLSLRNITLLLSSLYIFGVCSCDLIYDFLITLSKRLTEIDVSTILTVLQCCGMKLRSDDPGAMKSFIVGVQNSVNELKTSSGGGETKINGKRMEFMLETICDIKNNKKRSKEDTAPHTRLKKWLQKLRVEDVLIRGLKWSKLLDPGKKGQWWLSADMTTTLDIAEEVASTIDKETLEAQKLLQLAAAQRMNTDSRRAIFCIIMSSEDYIDAFEKLLRLDLSGKQDREIMRVLVECCLQEKVFNKYYAVLASKLCQHDKNHKFTLQYCFWDHFKELESMSLQRSMHLAKLVTEMIASFTLSLTILKAVDLTEAEHLTPKRIMHFRMLFEAIFEHPDNLIWNIFTRVAVNPEYETLRNDVEFFMKEFVVKTNKVILNKFKVAKQALGNAEGVLK